MIPPSPEARQAEELLTLKEFADLFQRNLSGMYRSIHRGRCPEATRIAGQWYVRVSRRDLEAARNRQSAA